MKPTISVTILTKNSQKYLQEVLTALQQFDEIVVCDTGSHDETMHIASTFPNVVLFERPFEGFGPTHNTASSLAKHDWILSIDSDEILTTELNEEIQKLKLERGAVYSIKRHNQYRGKWIRWCGWHPDYQIRLYNRLDTQFTSAQVHEAVQGEHLKKINLKNPLKHFPYETTADFVAKMQSYSSLFALQYQGKKSSSLGKAIAHSLFAFFKSYILKRGMFGGQEGFEISIYNANTAFYKYLKLAEANLLLKKRAAEESADGQKKRPTV